MPGIPTPNTDIAALVPPTIKGRTSPIISTAPGERDGTRAGGGGGTDPQPNPVGIIFQDNFDDQPDWHSGLPENDRGGIPNGFPDTTQLKTTGHTLPAGWDYVYQNPTLAPHQGDTDKREVIEIKAADSAKAKGGSGKCALFQRVSYSETGSWTSDGQLVKVLEVGVDEIYVEFEIAFEPGWTAIANGDQSKIFRIESWNGEQPISLAFPGGNLGPALIWNWLENSYGVRNQISLRGGPPGENYYLPNGDVGGLPQSSNAISLNYTFSTVGKEAGGADPHLADKLNGGFLSLTEAASHGQVFGVNGEYTRIGFFVKMNSAPGVADGILKQWVDGQRIVNTTGINWIPSLPEGVVDMPKWNLIGFGGNDSFKAYSIDSRVQEWYAIDNVIIRDSIPSELS